VLFTESFKDTEGQPLVVRWAKALKHYAEKAPIAIFDDELIVGRPQHVAGPLGHRLSRAGWQHHAVWRGHVPEEQGQAGEVVVTDEDARIINDVLTPYWTGKDYATNFLHALPEDTRFMLMGPDPKNTILWTCVVVSTSPMRHSRTGRRTSRSS